MTGKPLNNSVRIDIHKTGFTAVEQVDTKEDQVEKATVLEIGEDVSKVQVGDTILFKAYNLDTIEVDGEIYNLIPEEDIKYLWSTSTTTNT